MLVLLGLVLVEEEYISNFPDYMERKDKWTHKELQYSGHNINFDEDMNWRENLFQQSFSINASKFSLIFQ